MNLTQKRILSSILLFIFAFAAFINMGSSPNRIDDCENLERRGSSRFYQWDPDYYYNKCYVDAATATKNVAYCLSVNQEDTQIRCIVKVTGDSATCGDVLTESLRDECYGDAAISSKDLLDCEKIVTASNRDMCYWDVAKITRTQQACELIGNEQTRGWCHASVAAR